MQVSDWIIKELFSGFVFNKNSFLNCKQIFQCTEDIEVHANEIVSEIINLDLKNFDSFYVKIDDQAVINIEKNILNTIDENMLSSCLLLFKNNPAEQNGDEYFLIIDKLKNWVLYIEHSREDYSTNVQYCYNS